MLSRALASKSGSAAMMARTMVPRLARPTALRSMPMARNTAAPRQMFVRLQHATKPAGATHQVFKPLDTFPRRHIGPDDADKAAMLKSIGLKDIDELLSKTIPPAIRSPKALALSEGVPERELLKRLKSIASKNKVYRSYIGMGYTDTVVPNVILRNVLENPAWYTQYTPYQPEISQGRLESLLNFQTMVSDMTGLPIANASLLDEGTAAAEAMLMCWQSGRRAKNTFIVDENCHPQTIACLKTRAESFNINVVVANVFNFKFEEHKKDLAGVLLQYPNTRGTVHDYEALTATVHAAGGKVAVATDLMALAVLKAPGEFGADIALGNSQRFGVPLGFGGPHAAFFACKDDQKRRMPGRLIGVSKDAQGKPALRLALQTREQHIRREKATSNICTAQALLANMSAMYAVYHGPEGIKNIANRIHNMTSVLAQGLRTAGYTIENDGAFFDTLSVKVESSSAVLQKALEKQINLRAINAHTVSMTLDESVTQQDVADLFSVFSKEGQQINLEQVLDAPSGIPVPLKRASPYLQHPVFNSYRSETEMLRYIHQLQSRDLSLVHSMIPLGSCTMKLNATTEMVPVTWPEFGNIHPFAPEDQTEGYRIMLDEFSKDLAEITGFDEVSLQPNSGAQGEYAGLRAIGAYHEARGESHRNVCLIPISAHGTNPASAAMAGMDVVIVKCDNNGNLDMADLKAKAEKHKDKLAAFMVTYPSTFGMFEPGVVEACETVHKYGGQVYMDGANLNAQIGLTKPAEIGADVCHMNLHKTFCIPHGGGGPGMGPIACKEHLAPHLPGHPVVKTGGQNAIGPVSAAPYGSASILPISWAYIKMMGSEGMTEATKTALLSANYMRARLADHYDILYTNENGMCGHEFIVDIRPFVPKGIEAIDVAKRLQDYGFHSPTMSFPVTNTLMVEPTESESKAELDRFCDAMIAIRKEIQDVIDGKVNKENNVLKNSPHSLEVMMGDKWDHPYTREEAAFPMAHLRQNKFWPSVARVDDAWGDRNLMCTCPSPEEYLDE
ncbi:glycine dehydrogenase [Lichtheimia ornata]|uniref:Glycine cleavage system P protein n=1 Tax=Lichtheimia ornata TaxID=688661 RepID=A0AAD7XZL7_9FUNG|nr:glycine dehydrogenase [Lichtheimia ornata]KAJ8656047.1 glycine dehydrogenase [Lichtheimia ornata]